MRCCRQTSLGVGQRGCSQKIEGSLAQGYILIGLDSILKQICLTGMGSQPSPIAHQIGFNTHNNHLGHFESPLLMFHPSNCPSFLVQQHQVQISGGEEEVRRQERMYGQRRYALPWHVRVVKWQLDQGTCYCIDSKVRGTVCLEYIQTRLAHFRLTHPPSHLPSQGQLQSFSRYEGIYVLLNSLQGYRLLSNKFQVRHPTPHSIGINSKAAVKVWLSEHWALNQENQKQISENVLIQEIISLVSERTQGGLEGLLKEPYNYLCFSFQSVLELLGEFTIEFSRGKKSLVERIAGLVDNRETGIEQVKQKHSLTKVRSYLQYQSDPPRPGQSINRLSQLLPYLPLSLVPTKIDEQVIDGSLQLAARLSEVTFHNSNCNERRFPDHGGVGNHQFYPQQTNNKTQNSSAVSSSQKTLRFTYQPSNPLGMAQRPAQQPGPHSSSPHMNNINNKKQPLSSLTFRFNLKHPKHHRKPIGPNRLKEDEEERQRKRWLQVDGGMPGGRQKGKEERRRLSPNLGVETYVNYDIEHADSKHVITGEVATFKGKSSMGKNTTGFIFQSDDESPYSQSSQQPFKSKPSPLPQLNARPLLLTPPQPNQSSLRDLTSEFRSLLQSSRTLQRQSNSLSDLSLSDYSQLPQSGEKESIECEEEGQPERRMFNQASEEVLGKEMVELHFYSIREVDEEVSYSVDEGK